MQRATAVRSILLGMAMVVLGAPEAMGLSVTISRINGYFSGSGGEFNIKPTTGDPLQSVISYYGASAVVNGGFESFCLEKNQYISVPETVNYVINTGAVSGGVAGGNPDPVSVGTAFLYTQFASGTLVGYNYTPGGLRSASAGLLQDAIWCLEDEQNCGTNAFITMVTNQFGSLANAKANNNGAYSVSALNNSNQNGLRQDMLVLTDGGLNTPVPEPGTMLLLGSGLLGLPLIRKLRKQS